MTSLKPQPAPPVLAELAALSPEERAARLADLTTPIQHAGTTTFLHAGEADTGAVHHFMARFPSFPPMHEVAPGLHAVTVTLPRGARVEYKLAACRHGHTVLAIDPFNPRRASDPFGSNSVAPAPGYAEPWWTASANDAGDLRPGYVQSSAFERRRTVNWYRSPGPGGRRPLVVVHDGSDFLAYAGLQDVLANLVAAGAIPPIVAAFIDPADRLAEYADDPDHARFVAEVVSAAVRRHGALADPAQHVYVGASMGAVAALSAAWRAGPVGGLVLLSGSFVTALGGPTERGPMFLPIIDFMERFQADPGRPAARIYQAVGVYEGLAPDNRAFASHLERAGADHVYEEARDGHHWHNWRDRLGPALTHTLAGSNPGAMSNVAP